MSRKPYRHSSYTLTNSEQKWPNFAINWRYRMDKEMFVWVEKDIGHRRKRTGFSTFDPASQDSRDKQHKNSKNSSSEKKEKEKNIDRYRDNENEGNPIDP
jgi:hypothetical protein